MTASTNSTGAETFFEAIEAGDRIRVAAELRSDPSLACARNSEGATALHYAALVYDQELIRSLVEAGGDMNAHDAKFGATPAGWAIESLRELGGALGIEIGWLCEAARTGNLPWATAMLSRLPFLARLPDATGTTPLQHAVAGGHEPMIALLRRHDMDAA